jgi:hypothetical protein
MLERQLTEDVKGQKNNTMLEKRGCQQLVYPHNRAVTSVELLTMWRIDKQMITGQQSHFAASLIMVPEKAGCRVKLQLCGEKSVITASTLL